MLKYSPKIAHNLRVMNELNKRKAELDGQAWKARFEFDDSVKAHLATWGLKEGRTVWVALREGKVEKRKVTSIQVLHGHPTSEDWQVSVHVTLKGSDYGQAVHLDNVHLKPGKHVYKLKSFL